MDDIREATPEILEAGRRYLAAVLALPIDLHRRSEREWRASGYLGSPLRDQWVKLVGERAEAQRRLIKALNWRTGWFIIDNILIRYDHNRWRKVYVEIRPRLSVVKRKRTATHSS